MYKKTVRDNYSEFWVIHKSQYKHSEGIQVLNETSNN